MKKCLLSFAVLLSSGLFSVYAQTDSLILKNGNVIVGEIKEMKRGVMTIKTDYSDTDFKIEWDGVREIYTETFFLITTMNGHRYNGRIKSTGDEKMAIVTDSGEETEVKMDELVDLQSVSKSFWSRLYASIDLGYNLTKANNLKQFTLAAQINYIANKWSAGMNFDGLSSTQDETDPIKRWNGDLTYRYFLPRDWYLLGQLSFLSNTEQKLDLRTSGKLGAGNFIVHTNKSYWGLMGGLSFNNEKYSTETSNQQSLEGFAGTELNLYDIGDLDLLTNLTAYPSFTDAGRWRVDFSLNTKYDLPLDFYIKLGFNLNFDNKPVEGATSTDYVFSAGFGWELDL